MLRKPDDILTDLTRNAPFGYDRTLRVVWDMIDDYRAELQVQLESAAVPAESIQKIQNGLEDYLAREYSY